MKNTENLPPLPPPPFGLAPWLPLIENVPVPFKIPVWIDIEPPVAPPHPLFYKGSDASE